MLLSAAKVYGLARVSSQSQATDGTSLDAQAEQLAAYCRAHGLVPPTIEAGTLAVEVESGGEAAQERRTEVERVMREASASVAAGTPAIVLVTKADRFSRHLPWGVSAVRQLVKRGVGWRSVGEGIDATTPNGDFILGIMLAVADQERLRIRERTVGARQRLRAQGFHVEGNAPVGLRIVERRLVPSDDAPYVRMMFALCIAGRSTREIDTELRAQFPAIPSDHSAVARRLRDRRYIGESCSVGSHDRRHTSGTWTHTHEAIVDADTWHRAQAALSERQAGGRRHAGESRTAAFLLRGILRCAHCGTVMIAHSPTPRESVKHGGYYVCRRRTERRRTGTDERCDGPIVRQADADAEVAELALERLGELAGVLSQPQKKRPPPTDTSAERARLLRRRERVVTAVSDGVVTHDAARRTMAEIEAAIAAIDARPVLPAPVDRGAVLGQVTALRRAWAALTVDERREAVRLLTDRVEARSTAVRKWQRGAWKIAVTWHEWE